MLNGDQFSEHVGNVVSSVQNATPSERRAGSRWYGRAHRDAVHSGQDIMPGVKVEHPSGNGQLTSPAGFKARQQYRKANPDTDMADLIREKRNSPETKRAAYEIAATSPASPSGMDWEKNSQAAFEGARMPADQYKLMKVSEEALSNEQLARGAKTKAANRGEPTMELQRTAENARLLSKDASNAARGELKGKASAFAGNKALISAYEIHNQIRTPEEGVSPLKTGHFAGNVHEPSKPGATVDEHMANIIGGRMKWNVKREGAPQQENTRSIAPITKPAGYNYASDVINAAGGTLGMAANQAQAIAWVHEKNVKNEVEGGGQSRQEKARNTINRNTSNRLLGNM